MKNELNNNLSTVRNFLDVTNKLVLSQNRDLIKKIFLKNNKFFFDIISAYYPLNRDTIYKYSDKWNWRELASNEHINWDQNFIMDNFPQWEIEHNETWRNLSFNRNIPWTIDLIRNNLENWQFNPKYITPDQCLSSNPDVIKNLEIIDAFTEYWNWEMLSKSHAIPWTTELIDKYFEKWDWAELSANTSLPWSFHFIVKFAHKWQYKYLMRHLEDYVIVQHKEFVLNNFSHTSPEYKIMSMFEVSETELLKHKNKLSWRLLGLFGKAKWSSESLQKFGNKLGWDVLSSNQNLNWSSDLISEFEDKWVWPKLFDNEGITWTLDLIEKYKIKLGLGEYHDYWREILPDYHDEYEEENDENIEINNQYGEEYHENDDFEEYDEKNENEYEEIEETIKYYREYPGTAFCESKNIDLSLKLFHKYRNFLEDYYVLENNDSIKLSEKLEDWPNEKKRFSIEFWFYAHKTQNIPPELITEDSSYHIELLCSNKNFSWTEEIFKKFKYQCDIALLAKNPAFPWSLDILREVLDMNPPLDGKNLIKGLVINSYKDSHNDISLVEFKDKDGLLKTMEVYDFYSVGSELRILIEERNYETEYEVSKMGVYRLPSSPFIWEVIKLFVDDQLITEVLDILRDS